MKYLFALVTALLIGGMFMLTGCGSEQKVTQEVAYYNYEVVCGVTGTEEEALVECPVASLSIEVITDQQGNRVCRLGNHR